MKLSVVIPVYNEKNTVEGVLRQVRAVDLEKEIIVVDDGSTDGTREILKKISDPEIKVVFQPRNFGKGAAIRRGLREATGEYVIIQDADLEYNPQDFKKMLEPVFEKGARVVYGNRFWKKVPGQTLKTKLARIILTGMTNFLYGAGIHDEATCYKLFKTEVIRDLDLQAERFEFCPEVTAKVRRKGLKIYEVPISYNPRGDDAGKKIKFRDGLTAILTLLRYRFWTGN